jgi:hypothetical protein
MVMLAVKDDVFSQSVLSNRRMSLPFVNGHNRFVSAFTKLEPAFAQLFSSTVAKSKIH